MGLQEKGLVYSLTFESHRRLANSFRELEVDPLVSREYLS